MEKLENSICLDSDILIDFLRNKREVVDWIDENKVSILATTIVNAFELYARAYNSKDKEKIKDVDELLSHFKILQINLSTAKKAGEECARLNSQGEMIENADLLIGVIALSEGYSLKTNNKKHFSRIEGLKIV